MKREYKRRRWIYALLNNLLMWANMALIGCVLVNYCAKAKVSEIENCRALLRD